MKIKVTRVYVDDQNKALKFYTDILGFIKKTDITAGDYRWLTVVSPQEPNGTELLLELDDNPAAKAFKKSLYEQGIPATQFQVDDLNKEYERIQKMGVSFKQKPTKMGPANTAIFDDTCGNLILINQL
ncbi:MAG: VOC family protein [Candidatus Bathyarchaeia archaeon]|jgi:catechol 2,3-dioxygenase-like lactoylglutathione lyase family enzyme